MSDYDEMHQVFIFRAHTSLHTHNDQCRNFEGKSRFLHVQCIPWISASFCLRLIYSNKDFRRSQEIPPPKKRFEWIPLQDTVEGLFKLWKSQKQGKELTQKGHFLPKKTQFLSWMSLQWCQSKCLKCGKGGINQGSDVCSGALATKHRDSRHVMKHLFALSRSVSELQKKSKSRKKIVAGGLWRERFFIHRHKATTHE